jgi:hypothetical protein
MFYEPLKARAVDKSYFGDVDISDFTCPSESRRRFSSRSIYVYRSRTFQLRSVAATEQFHLCAF